jgi:hypothetical protein
MAKDIFHNQVKTTLIKDGWTITHDPFVIRISEAIKLQIDLAAENAIAAEQNREKIAVEIKSFIADSDISEFHTLRLVNTLIMPRQLKIRNPIAPFSLLSLLTLTKTFFSFLSFRKCFDTTLSSWWSMIRIGRRFGNG